MFMGNGRSWIRIKQNTAIPCSIGLLVVEEDVLGALVKIYIVVREICLHVVFGQTG